MRCIKIGRWPTALGPSYGILTLIKHLVFVSIQ